MLSLLSSVLVAQVNPQLSFRELEPPPVVNPSEVRPLPGKLDDVLVFNSNSPEVVQTDGILLSTFPPSGKRFPNAHLNQPLSGRFDFFSHHIARPVGQQRTLYQGAIIHNPTGKSVRLRILQGASYLTSPDAPFVDLPGIVEDPNGKVFSGPGSRLMGDILRGANHPNFPSQIIIPPYQNRLLFSLPIKASNARSTFLRLESDGPLYLANLAMYAVAEIPPTPPNSEGEAAPPVPTFREPTLEEWRYLLVSSQLVQPRDLPPTPLEEATFGKTIYSRVAGISVGSEWVATLADGPGKSYLSTPPKGKAFSYPLSTVTTGTYGTKQVQSAPMLVRYADTALRAHGNYGVRYNLTLPLANNSSDRKTVTVSLQTPIKQNQYADRLFFFEPPQERIFFRGTVRVAYTDDRGQPQTRYFHVIQRRGEQGQPLITLNMLPGDRREVTVDLLYPPDATPPQVITVRTLDLFYGRAR